MKVKMGYAIMYGIFPIKRNSTPEANRYTRFKLCADGLYLEDHLARMKSQLTVTNEDCRRLGYKVLPKDVNATNYVISMSRHDNETLIGALNSEAFLDFKRIKVNKVLEIMVQEGFQIEQGVLPVSI